MKGKSSFGGITIEEQNSDEESGSDEGTPHQEEIQEEDEDDYMKKVTFIYITLNIVLRR